MYTQEKKLPSGKGQTNGPSSTKQVKNNFRAISFKASRVFNKPVKNISLHEVIAGEGLRSLKARKGLHFNIQISDIYWSFSSIRAYKLIFCIYSSYLTYAFFSSFHSPYWRGERNTRWLERNIMVEWYGCDKKKNAIKCRFIIQQKQTCFVLVWKKELADIWNVSPLNISVMFGFPYKVYSCSPTDVLPTDEFTLFMTLTCIYITECE